MSKLFNYTQTNYVPTTTDLSEIMPKLLNDARKITATSEDIEILNPSNNSFHLNNGNTLSFNFGTSRRSYMLTQHSMQQLCTKLKFPHDYAAKLYRSRSNDFKELLNANISTLMNHYNSGLLLRTTDQYLRGILTPKYCAFDSDQILDVLSSCLDRHPFYRSNDFILRGYCNSMDILNLRITTAEPRTALKDKDIFYGLQICSSDVGIYSLSISFFIYKQICTNGMGMNLFKENLFYQRHIGINKDTFYQGIIKATNLLPLVAKKVDKIIMHADSINLSNGPMFDFSANDDYSIFKREQMKKFLGVGDSTLQHLANIAEKHYGTSLWDYGNAITEWAQGQSFQRRKELEEKAGQLVTLGKSYLKVA